MAKRMHHQNDCLHRLFYLTGFPREIRMRDHPLRLRIEWTLSRLRSHLMSARPRYLGSTPVPDEEQVPPLAFWVGWPRMREELER